MSATKRTLADVRAAAERAEQDFWSRVAIEFPEIKSGDFEPFMAAKFSAHCRQVIIHWYIQNEGSIDVQI